jgi:hypothetical protein
MRPELSKTPWRLPLRGVKRSALARGLTNLRSRATKCNLRRARRDGETLSVRRPPDGRPRAESAAKRRRAGTQISNEGFAHICQRDPVRGFCGLRNRMVASRHERSRIQPGSVPVRAAGVQQVSGHDRIFRHRQTGTIAIRLQVVWASPELHGGARSLYSAHSIRCERKCQGGGRPIMPSIQRIRVQAFPRTAEGKPAAFARTRRVHRIKKS